MDRPPRTPKGQTSWFTFPAVQFSNGALTLTIGPPVCKMRVIII